jgi:hypothetical protein
VAHIIPFDDARHREAQLNLPWYVMGELGAPERARLEAHLAVCPECQADLQFEYRLRTEYQRAPLGVPQEGVQPAPGADAPDALPKLSWRAVRRWIFARDAASRLTSRFWLSAAVAVQSVLIVGLVALAATRVAEPSFRALGASPSAGQTTANIVVIFQPGATAEDLRLTLTASNARIVDGPSAAGAYFLRVQDGERDAALATLRNSAAVASAQPIDQEPP